MHPDGKAGDFTDDVRTIERILRGFQVYDLLGNGVLYAEECQLAVPFQK